MATQYDPIAKDESLNTTETPSRNVADVLAEELQNIAQAIGGSGGDSVSWTQIQSTGTKIAEIEINGTSQNVYAPNGGGGGGGHVIEGADGTALSQEPTLQFADADATDDAVNEKTVVNVVRKRTQAQYDAMSAADQTKGIIQITDANAKPLFDTQVRRSNGDGTVADALDAPFTLLWNNTDDSQEMAAGSESADFSDYSLFLVVSRNWKTGSSYANTLAIKGTTTIVTAPVEINNQRAITIANDGFTVQNSMDYSSYGNSGSQTANNGRNIISKVYGLF